MINTSNKSLIYLAINTGCAVSNFYFAPKAFAMSYAIGVIVGCGMGLKRRLDIRFIDIKEKAKTTVSTQASQAAVKASELSAPLQGAAADGLNKFSQYQTVQAATGYAKEAANKAKPLLERAAALAKPFFDLYMYYSGYGAVVDQIASYVGWFDEQRMKVIAGLNPIPGIKGTLLSLAALAANAGYMTLPVLNKMWILSGFTAGYAAGLYVMRQTEWSWLQSEGYSKGLSAAVL